MTANKTEGIDPQITQMTQIQNKGVLIVCQAQIARFYFAHLSARYEQPQKRPVEEPAGLMVDCDA
jgi:hypothetical protein